MIRAADLSAAIMPTIQRPAFARRRILAPSLVYPAAFDDDALDETVDTFGKTLFVYRDALHAGSVEPFGVGWPVQPTFRRRSGTDWASAAPSGGDGAVSAAHATAASVSIPNR